MMLNEDGFQAAPDWLYWLADVVITFTDLGLVLHFMFYYSHADERFSRTLTKLNVFSSLVTLIAHLLLLVWPPLCAFYLIESLFFTCEFNLFQFRTAMFYQTDKPYYNKLFHLAMMNNALMTYHNFIGLATFVRNMPLKWGCRLLHELKTYTVGVPVFALKLYFLGLGFYTVHKYWHSSGEESRRKMSILWLILVTYACDFMTAIATVFLPYDEPNQFVREFVNTAAKALSLVLAYMIHQRVREREAVKAAMKTTMKATSQNSSADTKKQPTAANRNSQVSLSKETDAAAAAAGRGSTVGLVGGGGGAQT